MLEETDNNSLSFRKKGLRDLFNRSGQFTPMSPALRSEIPRNTLEFQPSDAFFVNNSGSCCTARWWRTKFGRRKFLVPCVAALVLFGALAILIGSIIFHVNRQFQNDQNSAEAVLKLPTHVYNTTNEEINTGENLEPLAPMFEEVVNRRVPAEIFGDNLEEYKYFAKRHQLEQQLSLVKARFRRSLSYRRDRILDCVGDDCDMDKIDEVLRELSSEMKSLQEDLDTMHQEITALRDKILAYDKSLLELFENPMDNTFPLPPALKSYLENIPNSYRDGPFGQDDFDADTPKEIIEIKPVNSRTGEDTQTSDDLEEDLVVTTASSGDLEDEDILDVGFTKKEEPLPFSQFFSKDDEIEDQNIPKPTIRDALVNVNQTSKGFTSVENLSDSLVMSTTNGEFQETTEGNPKTTSQLVSDRSSSFNYTAYEKNNGSPKMADEFPTTSYTENIGTTTLFDLKDINENEKSLEENSTSNLDKENVIVSNSSAKPFRIIDDLFESEDTDPTIPDTEDRFDDSEEKYGFSSSTLEDTTKPSFRERELSVEDLEMSTDKSDISDGQKMAPNRANNVSEEYRSLNITEIGEDEKLGVESSEEKRFSTTSGEHSTTLSELEYATEGESRTSDRTNKVSEGYRSLNVSEISEDRGLGVESSEEKRNSTTTTGDYLTTVSEVEYTTEEKSRPSDVKSGVSQEYRHGNTSEIDEDRRFHNDNLDKKQLPTTTTLDYSTSKTTYEEETVVDVKNKTFQGHKQLHSSGAYRFSTPEDYTTVRDIDSTIAEETLGEKSAISENQIEENGIQLNLGSDPSTSEKYEEAKGFSVSDSSSLVKQVENARKNDSKEIFDTSTTLEDLSVVSVIEYTTEKKPLASDHTNSDESLTRTKPNESKITLYSEDSSATVKSEESLTTESGRITQETTESGWITQETTESGIITKETTESGMITQETTHSNDLSSPKYLLTPTGPSSTDLSNQNNKLLSEIPSQSELENLLAETDSSGRENVDDFKLLDHSVFAQSLEDIKIQKKLLDKKPWGSKVVGSIGEPIPPSGPDNVVGVGEDFNAGQQLSYGQFGLPQFVVPTQVCFFANPNTKGLSNIWNVRSRRSFQLGFPPYGLKTVTPAPDHSQNVFNIYMTNNPPQPTAPHPMFPLSMPMGVVPHQRPHARQQPLFCSYLQPPLFEFPTISGSSEAGHSRCINCIDTPASVEPRKDVHQRNEGTLNCPQGTSRCKDDLLCIPSIQWCDGKVHCSDASDELFCSCNDRISDTRRCDGYPDCPLAEDELDCFNCPAASFSCGTYDERTSCIALDKRCDGLRDCPDGRDENGCSILVPSLINATFHVSYTEGFLMHNWRGSWYAVCEEASKEKWAQQACSEELGGDDRFAESVQADIPKSVKGPFLAHLEDGNFKLEHHCKGHMTVHVQCPPMRCGFRFGDKDQMVARIKRLVEQLDSPNPAEQPFVSWLEDVEKSVAKQYNVPSVVAKLVPEPDDAEDLIQKTGKREETGRVVGGQGSAPHAWPWAVAILKDGFFTCGGVLLDVNWVMTAAHCVTDFQDHYYEVRLGMLRQYSFGPMEQVRHVSEIIVHEGFEMDSMKNDLAIMKLSSPVLYNRWIRPSCLPVRASIGKEGLWGPSPGERCIAIGWGALKEHGVDPDQLREVVLPILESCKHREDVEGGEICAGFKAGGKDTCQGDSGGPLMCRDSKSRGAWYVAGIVSHGQGCARPDEPGAYTRVSLFIDWLVEKSNEAKFGKAPKQKCPGFQCTSHTSICLPSFLRCNGMVNCLGGEDEMDCAHHSFKEAKNKTNVDEEIVEKSLIVRKPTPIKAREEIKMDDDIFNYTHPFPHYKPFQCEWIDQRIPGYRKCDGIQDCEDASDEWECSCKDILYRERPTAICDGYVDCQDKSDEDSCFKCPNDFYNCRHSHQCVFGKKKCDGFIDCLLGEDESNCMALTDNVTLVLDKSGEPLYENNGLLIVNRKGVWSFACNNDKAIHPKEVCRELGLIGAESIQNFDVSNIILDSMDLSNSHLSELLVESVTNCTGISVTCDNRISTPKRIIGGAATWDWDVFVRVNGSVVCTAILLTDQWLMASSFCFSSEKLLEKDYITAELGQREYPPKMMRVDNIQFVADTDLLLLHLQHKLRPSRNTRPIQLPSAESSYDHRACLAIGRGSSVKILPSKSNCSRNQLCFTRATRPERGCRSDPWVGVAVCDSSTGWIPIGAFREIGGSCGFQSTSFSYVLSYLKEINAIIDGPILPSAEQVCKGMRCLGGACIPESNTCDGWPQCPFLDDEGVSACFQKSSANCRRNQMRCSDGTCFPKTVFGNNMTNCGDGADEPWSKSCVNYLQLAAPHRVCDGSRNCYDKSDELPDLCNCTSLSFRCNESSRCIPNEFVCDGQNDCLSGEDERNCVGFHKISRRSKLYEYRNMSYGVWHSVCDTNLSRSDATILCQREGHKEAVKIDAVSIRPLLPILDVFTRVKINNDTTVVLRGDRPFVTLKLEDRPCTVSYVTCY